MNFTIEWFQYMTSDLGNPRVFSINSFPTAKIAVSIESSIFRLWINSGIRFQEPVSLILNNWTHFAIVYTNGSIKIYKNGSNLAIGQTANNTGIVVATVTCILYLNGTTDYVEAYGRQDAVGTQNNFNLGSLASFQGCLMRAA